MHHRVALGDLQPLADVGAGPGDLLGVAEHPHGLSLVHGGALHLRRHLEPGQLRVVGRIDHVAAHVVKALARLLGALEVAPRHLGVGGLEPPGAGLPVHPAVEVTQVEHLPGLQHDGLSGLHAPGLDALSEPPQDPVGTGHVEHIGEVTPPLPLQVVQKPLAGQLLIPAALVLQPSPHHLLGVHRGGVVLSRLPLRPCLLHLLPSLKRGFSPVHPNRSASGSTSTAAARFLASWARPAGVSPRSLA